jgi:large subunit ribosomal protein L32
MGALPKRKISTARKGRRRHSIKLKLATLVKCSFCGKFKKPHFACPHCGKYKDNKKVS